MAKPKKNRKKTTQKQPSKTSAAKSTLLHSFKRVMGPINNTVFKWVNHDKLKETTCMKLAVKAKDYLALNVEIPDDGKVIAKGPIRFGAVALTIFFGIFGAWAILIPLDAGAVSQGSVVLHFNKKTIQHLEGGIIQEILVEENSVVEKDQPLVKLDETTARANLDLIRKQLFSLKAAEARLLAERDEKPTIDFAYFNTFPDTSAFIEDILAGERKLFVARKKGLSGQVGVLKQKKLQLKNEIQGFKFQRRSVAEQLKINEEEINTQTQLFNEGYVSKEEIMRLKKHRAFLIGNLGDYRSKIAKAEQEIAEVEMDITNAENHSVNDVVAELQEVRSKISDAAERVVKAKDALKRCVIRAPQSGVVTGLRFHTKGGVVSPGSAIMDIVPQDDQMIVEAKVSPQDIDVIHEGLMARVRLSAYKARKVPLIEGEVLNVSADRFVDHLSGASYYLARIKIPDTELESLDHVKLYPGMPVDVLIVTGSHTFWSYFFSPVKETFSKAFRES